MATQDDAREAELAKLFGLRRGDSRGGVDATLELSKAEIPFELKSTTKGSVTTVRDFGPDHILKWRNMHWIIGVYSEDARLLYCHYGSPTAMTPWIEEKAKYVRPDFALAERAPQSLGFADLKTICGDKAIYTLEDAQQIQKRQFSMADYRAMMDVEDGYTPAAMLRILQARCRYIIERGATLNNPKIPAGYFSDWEKITTNHKTRLRELVKDYFSSLE